MLDSLFKKIQARQESKPEIETTWQQRLIAERGDLAVREGKLHAFLSSGETIDMDFVDLKLLEHQLAAMKTLLGVLDVRIERLKAG